MKVQGTQANGNKIYSINGRTMAGTWVPILGVMLVGGEKYYKVDFCSAEQAAIAAVAAQPEMDHADIQVVNNETGEVFSVAHLLAKVCEEYDAWESDREEYEWERDCAAMNAAERNGRDYMF